VGISPCFSPDSKYVIYSLIEDPKNNLYQFYRIPVGGGVPEKITGFDLNSDFFSFPLYPEISPDGQWILFQGTFSTDFTTQCKGPCVLNLKTGKTYKAAPNAAFIKSRARWLPDGSGFIYSREKLPVSDGISNTLPNRFGCIYTVNFDPTEFWKPSAIAENAPLDFSITQNYPNPFNPSTTISFTLPSSGPISLAVYDITGRKVRELVNGPLSAGEHSAVWDGRDEQGNPVSSGIYLSRLTQGEKTVSRRMTLIK
jgi:hypothetical protein